MISAANKNSDLVFNSVARISDFPFERFPDFNSALMETAMLAKARVTLAPLDVFWRISEVVMILIAVFLVGMVTLPFPIEWKHKCLAWRGRVSHFGCGSWVPASASVHTSVVLRPIRKLIAASYARAYIWFA